MRHPVENCGDITNGGGPGEESNAACEPEAVAEGSRFSEARAGRAIAANGSPAIHPEIPDETFAKWQRITNLMARIARVPAGLIMKVDPPQIEVFAASATEGNPYARGERADLGTGLYCETVMAKRSTLLVPDALKDPKWDHNPDVELNMVFYLGLPIQWPDGDIFGTICVLDDKENQDAIAYAEVMEEFKEVIETDLQNLFVTAERDKAVGALHESETRYRDLFDHSVSGVGLFEIVLDDQGKPIDYVVLEANRALEEATGLKVDEIIGRRASEILPSLEDRIVAECGRVASTGEPVRFEQYSRSLDRHLAITAFSPRRGQFAVVLDDISERVKLADATQRRAEELAALQDTVLHITAAQELPTVLHTIVERAAELLGAAGGGMYLCDPEKQQLRCVVSYNTARDYVGTVLQYGEGAAGVVAQTREPVILDDYRDWNRRAAVFEEDQPFSAVLSVPMIWQGQVTGVLVVLEDIETRRFTQNDLDLLTLLGNHAAIAVENARLYTQARDEIIERERAREQLRVSLQEKEVLLQEIHHRVRNNLALVSSLLAWQSETIEDEKSLAVFQESQSRIRSMALIHEHLYTSPDLAQVDMAKYTKELVSYLSQSHGSHDVSLTVDTADVAMDIARAIPVGLIINELVSNCMQHAFPDGRAGAVDVTLRRFLSEGERKVELIVSDDGIGAPEGLDLDNIESLGLNVVRLLVRQLNGSLELDRSDGSTFRIVLPCPEQTAAQED